MNTKKESRSYAYNLISEGKDDITKLSEVEKEELTANIIESYDKFRAYEFIGEPVESSDYAYQLAKYMKSRKIEDALDLVDSMIKGAIKQAGNEIVDLLIEQEEEYKFNKKFE